jgi:hypothetical protein
VDERKRKKEERKKEKERERKKERDKIWEKEKEREKPKWTNRKIKAFGLWLTLSGRDSARESLRRKRKSFCHLLSLCVYVHQLMLVVLKRKSRITMHLCTYVGGGRLDHYRHGTQVWLLCRFKGGLFPTACCCTTACIY